jgi:hypothetical protein
VTARTVLQAGRRKAYRPLPVAERAAAVRHALEAWQRGDWFETHELLEPAWMGADAVPERLRIQAAIKVAAAFVHQARGNRAGMRTNLAGARARLADASVGDPATDDSAFAVAIDRLMAAVDDERVPLREIEAPDLPGLLARLELGGSV